MRCFLNTLLYAHNDIIKTDLMGNLTINLRKNSLETYVSHKVCQPFEAICEYVSEEVKTKVYLMFCWPCIIVK
jgi:hypothetical protein